MGQELRYDGFVAGSAVEFQHNVGCSSRATEGDPLFVPLDFVCQENRSSPRHSCRDMVRAGIAEPPARLQLSKTGKHVRLRTVWLRRQRDASMVDAWN